MDDFRTPYFEALGFEALGTNAKTKRKDALARAHEIRKFEIELYWKRAAYFWAFQLIAFTALGLLFKDGRITPLGQLSLGRLLIPAPIGVITAFAGYLTARGSKFWQENWEAHVDFLEDATEGRLTQVIMCSSQAPQFSVSRINQRLLGYLTFGWAVVLIVGATPKAAERLRGLSSWLGLIVSLITLGLAYGLWRTRTDFTGCMHSGDKTSWREYPPKHGGKGCLPFIIWRYRFAKQARSDRNPDNTT